MDLPADLIQGIVEDIEDVQGASVVADAPKGRADDARLSKIVQLLKTAKAPLIVIGKGAAYAQAENVIRDLINMSQIPFLPTPMGKGVVADSHPLNTASARSTALKHADVVLILGARLNWILHFGEPPKWNPAAKFIQVDISPEELGRNGSDASLSLVGDISIVTTQILGALGSWKYSPSSSPYLSNLSAAKSRNESAAAQKAAVLKTPMTYANVFSTIKDTLHVLSPPEEGRIVYVSEGANTMDISRSIFPVEHPRLRLDAGTYATMGVGLGYAIAAHAAYNGPSHEGATGPNPKNKKIVALEGDSAFGFSAMEVETMARYGMDILIFVINNGGVYHGDVDSADEWLARQQHTLSSSLFPFSSSSSSLQEQQTPAPTSQGLRSTSLGYEVRYDYLASACGGLGFCVRTPDELRRATETGFRSQKGCVVNVIVESGSGGKLEFGWQGGGGKKGKGKGARLWEGRKGEKEG